ncbi:hypothetical protein ASZ90_013821 [hydrocarbon metagenome]|uniref:Uncharacterized protein n=1 Tax=hydrocarbon metagenome TaxID=938273 RepID=A0A0W8F6J4_9ZZZZ
MSTKVDTDKAKLRWKSFENAIEVNYRTKATMKQQKRLAIWISCSLKVDTGIFNLQMLSIQVIKAFHF